MSHVVKYNTSMIQLLLCSLDEYTIKFAIIKVLEFLERGNKNIEIL